VETLLGFGVLLVAGIFLVYLQNRTSTASATGTGYDVKARFERVDGLATGSDVKLAGIKVGTITNLKLDPKSFFAEAVIHLNDPQIQLPDDTMAQVASDGLLGGRYVSLVPGGSDGVIAAGGTITFTQPPFDLVQALGQYIFSEKSTNKTAGKAAGSQGGSMPAPVLAHPPGSPAVAPYAK
jgi:phospholipid/cholesterol/gamma-HCH transport system substrate-binding protein